MSEKISLFDMLAQKEKAISTNEDNSGQIKHPITPEGNNFVVENTAESVKNSSKNLKTMKRPLINRGVELKPDFNNVEQQEIIKPHDNDKILASEIEITPLIKEKRKIIDVMSGDEDLKSEIIIEAKKITPKEDFNISNDVKNNVKTEEQRNIPDKVIINTQSIISVKKERKDQTIVANGILVLMVVAFSLYSSTISPLF